MLPWTYCLIRAGLFQLMVRFSLEGITDSCQGLPYCECAGGPGTGQKQYCYFSVDSWGHGGLDWGSGQSFLEACRILILSFLVFFFVGRVFDQNWFRHTVRLRPVHCHTVCKCRLHVLTGHLLVYPIGVRYAQVSPCPAGSRAGTCLSP